MSYYESCTGEKFHTTALYDNRAVDKKKLENLTDLKEAGIKDIYLYTPNGTLVSEGYIRIVYGDHGPYIELLKKHITWKMWVCERKDVGYYNKWYPNDGSRILLYEQRFTVRNLENPPRNEHSFQGNRKEGYADYRPGRIYLSPYNIKISWVKHP